MVKFRIDHKFKVDKFGQYEFGQPYVSPCKRLIFNKICLNWYLQIFPKGATDPETGLKSDCGVFVGYRDGPKAEISTVSFQFYVLKNRRRLFCCCSDEMMDFQRKGRLWGLHSTGIPTTIRGLADKNYLNDINSVLHIEAELDIPTDAFDDLNSLYSVFLPSPNLDFHHDFVEEEFDRITDNNDSHYRFEIISHDGCHFWVHKHIMINRSPVFEAMFNSEAGIEGLMIECCNNCVSIKDVSGAALEEILRFMYLGDVNELNDQIIYDVLLFASVHFLDDLKLICENFLLEKCESSDLTFEELIEMSIESERFGLKVLKECCISCLAQSWIDVFDDEMCMIYRFYYDTVGREFLKDLLQR